MVAKFVKPCSLHYTVDIDFFLRQAIRHALDLWSEVIELDFYEVSNTSLRALIQFKYGVNFRDSSIG